VGASRQGGTPGVCLLEQLGSGAGARLGVGAGRQDRKPLYFVCYTYQVVMQVPWCIEA